MIAITGKMWVVYGLHRPENNLGNDSELTGFRSLHFPYHNY